LVTTAGLAYAALVAPLLWYLVTVDGDPLYWVSDRTSSALVDVGRALAGGTRWGVIAYTAAAAVGLVAAARAGARLRASDRWEEALPALWLVAPVAVVTASTATVKPLLAPRFLIVVLPALVLVAAVGLRALSRPLAAAL